MLAARGIEIPSPGEKPKKKPFYGKPRKNKKEDKSKVEAGGSENCLNVIVCI